MSLIAADPSATFGRNLDAYWMPFTPNRRFKRQPRMMAGAEGCYYLTEDGERLLDGSAGLWCVNAGHGRREISEAIAAQASRLDYVSSFNMGHRSAFELAERLAALAPGDLNHVFYTNSGSEAVDTALKIALAYHLANGQGERQRLIGRAKAYHGVGFGGLSVAGLGYNRGQFGLLLPGTAHIPHTYDPDNLFVDGQPEHGAHLANPLESLVALADPSTVAAVIVETVTGVGGVLAPPVGYLERLRAICDAHGILLIFDEVITGFSRLGANFAADRFGVVPDLMTCAKGLTNGAVPMGAVLVRDGVHDALMQGPPNAIELYHGYTCSGHPLACAAALATLDIHADEDLPGRVRDLEPVWSRAAHALKATKYVKGVRTIGLLCAIDLHGDAEAPGRRAAECFAACWDQGVLIRNSGDSIVLSPPLVIEPAEIEWLFATIAANLERIV